MENENLGEMTLNYNTSSNSLTYGEGSSSLNWGWYGEYWIPYYQPYYVSYPVYITDKDKFEKAFKIGKLLLKKKLLKSRKLKDFIGLIEEIAKEL